MPAYNGLYRARAVKLQDGVLSAYIPQVFGDTAVSITDFLGDPPTPPLMGWVAFHAGAAEVPIWLGSPAGGSGGGSVADVMWVGPDAPTDPDIELWWDTDEPSVVQQVVTSAATAYTPPLSLAGGLVVFTAATAIAFMVPTNAVSPFSIGTRIDIVQTGAGKVTVSAPGVTLAATPSAVLRATGSHAWIIKISTNGWVLSGDLT